MENNPVQTLHSVCDGYEERPTRRHDGMKMCCLYRHVYEGNFDAFVPFLRWKLTVGIYAFVISLSRVLEPADFF